MGKAQKRAAKQDNEESPKKSKGETETPAPKVTKNVNGTNGNVSPPKKTKTNKRKRGGKKGKKGPTVTVVPSETTLAMKKQSQNESSVYLSKWDNDKTNWKFNKNIQNWIINHIFDNELVSDDSFETAISYFEGSVGNARTRLESMALDKIKKFEKMDELEEDDQTQMDRAQRLVKLGVAEKKAEKKVKSPAKKGATGNKTPKKVKTPQAEEAPNKKAVQAKVVKGKTPQASQKTPQASKKASKKSSKKTSG